MNNNKTDRWHNETLIGTKSTNLHYWGQYNTLIKFVLDDYQHRKETIAAPLLHLISHSLELGYKENIGYFVEKLKDYHSIITLELPNRIYHKHSLKKLHEVFEKHIRKINHTLNVKPNLVNEFESLNSRTKQLLRILKVETPTYRYAEEIDRAGNKTGNKVVKDIEKDDGNGNVEKKAYSINIIDIIDLYNDAMTMLTHTADVLGEYTDYLDFQKDFPHFTNGKGYLLIHKQSINQKNIFFDSMDNKYSKIRDNLWQNTNSGEYIQAFETNKFLYFVPLKNKPE